MPARRHEILVAVLREQPALLSALVQKLTGRALRPGLAPVDSTVRFVETAEVRPDILLARRDDWAVVEVQNQPDPEKRRRWPLAASLLLDQTGKLGDVIVITARASVAAWAKTVAHVRTPLGTRLKLTPVVLHVGPDTLDDLLTADEPGLAVVATWAVSHRHGPDAQRVVERAIEVSDTLPAALQEAQRNAILSLLNERLIAWLEEMRMDPSKIPMSPAARRLSTLWAEQDAKVRADGLAKGMADGKREALLAVLAARGLSPTAKERATIDACSDPATLDRWIVGAMTAAAIGDLLASKSPAPPAARPRARKAPAGGVKRRVKRT